MHTLTLTTDLLSRLVTSAEEAEAVRLTPHPVPFLFLIPLLPAIGAAVNAAIGWKLQRTVGKKVVHFIAIGSMTLAALLAVVAFGTLVNAGFHEHYLYQKLWNVFDTGNGFSLNLAFSLDSLSMTMTLIVTIIGTLIHVYSIGYMADEPAYWRFFCYLNFFCFSMLTLVMADNFGLMFYGWEGVGLASYLLIGFWYTEIKNAIAGNKAFIVNRIGDFSFVLGLFLLFWLLAGSPTWGHIPGAHATIDFNELRNQFVYGGVGDKLAHKTIFGVPALLLIGVLIFGGATGKSAQIPLYVWLPDAMAGPTPVSALIHAATMVTAGVYLIARLSFLYAFSPEAMTVIAVIGVATALFAATIGFFQYDIKKVLAYSTVSQLGFMFIGVGVGAWWAGIYHLFTHACFKACLFLGSGSVILGCHHEQDMRKMGGLGKLMPLTSRTYWYACVCITAAPIFFLGNGFFSKDEILWKAFSAGSNIVVPGALIYLVGLVAAAGTSFYMWRSYYMTFTGEYRGGHSAHDDTHAPAPTHGADSGHGNDAAHGHDAGGHDAPGHGEHGHGGTPHESPWQMTYVLVALCGLAVFSIVLGFWPLLGHFFSAFGQPLFERWLHPSLPMMALVESRSAYANLEAPVALEWGLAGASVLLALASWYFAKWLYADAKNPAPARWLAKPLNAGIHKVIFNKYYVDELYAVTVVRLTMFLKDAFYAFDRYVIDGIVKLCGAIIRRVSAIDGWIDKWIVDGMVNLVAGIVIALGRRVQRIQTGRIQTYLYGALVGALLIVAINYVIR
jgi:NADH-quinone oxidoreductase subunit L